MNTNWANLANRRADYLDLGPLLWRQPDLFNPDRGWAPHERRSIGYAVKFGAGKPELS